MPPAAEWRYCPLCRAELADRVLDAAPRRACPACGFVFWEHPRPAAAAVVAAPDGRVALVRRRYPPEAGGWCLPGGFVEAGETIEAAACREVREETGLEVSPVRQLGVLGPCIAFVATRPAGGVLEPGSDVLEAAWFAPEEAPPLCFPTHRTVLEAWSAGRG